jgi:hypothetical protein
MKWLDLNEPRLEDALSDPVICAMMARDGIDPREVLALLQRVDQLRQKAEARSHAA